MRQVLTGLFEKQKKKKEKEKEKVGGSRERRKKNPWIQLQILLK